METVVYIVGKLFGFFLLFAISLLLFGGMLKLWSDKFNFNTKKAKLYGILFDLSNRSIFALSAVLIRYLFFVWTMFAGGVLEEITIVVLLLLIICYNSNQKRIKGIFFDLMNTSLQYFLVYCHGLIGDFLSEVRFEGPVATIRILLTIFLLIYLNYTLLQNINEIVKDNRYVRRRKHENSLDL